MANYNKKKGYKSGKNTSYNNDNARNYDQATDDEKYEDVQLGGIDSLRPSEFFKEKEYEENETPEILPVRSRAMMPRSEDEPIQSLRRVSPEIIGSLFDRIGFLEQRVQELEEAMKTRKKLHEQMIAEIDKDVDEKNAMIRSISDMDEQRNLKLDISVLRREKRREYVQYWRDVLELRTEMRELMEELQIENKIAGMFKNINPNAAKTAADESHASKPKKENYDKKQETVEGQ